MKTCRVCKIEKPFSDFHKHSATKDRVQPYCKACYKQINKKRYIENTEQIANRTREWRLANPEKDREIHRKWREDNREKAREISSKWRGNNRSKAIAMSAKCRSKGSVPAWANFEQIALIYEEADFATEFFGIPFHVDHIVPLNGMRGKKKIVCGLHWEGNLQVLRATENLSKSNSWWPDMPTS